MTTVNVLLLEDHDDTRQWLHELLLEAFDRAHIDEAASLAQARRHLARQNFQLAIIDLHLPDGNGIDILKQLTAERPDTFCVVATIFDDDQHIIPAIQAGAQGYLLKEQPKEKLLSHLQGIVRGEPPLSPPVARRILKHFRRPPSQETNSGLTRRETDILTMIAKGLNRAEIGKLMDISPNTVATHIGTIYNKLNISSRAEATMEAVRMGLVHP